MPRARSLKIRWFFALAVILAGIVWTSLILGRSEPHRDICALIDDLKPTFVMASAGGRLSYVEASSFEQWSVTFPPAQIGVESAESRLHLRGTNAIPHLLERLAAGDSRARILSARLLTTMRLPLPQILAPRAAGRRAQAVTALRLLGTNVCHFAPQLRSLTNHPDAQVRAIASIFLQDCGADR